MTAPAGPAGRPKAAGAARAAPAKHGGPVIELESVVRTYRVGRDVIRALDGVSLRIDRGEFVAIRGSSGSGKTTLLNVIGCIDSPQSGTVRLEGRDVAKLPERELSRIRLARLGFVFQQFHLLPVLTAMENVELPMREAGVPRAERSRRAGELLRLVDLIDRANHRPSQLSGGEMQRVCIARALANRPGILLADEPTGEIDTKTAGRIMALLTRLNERIGLTIVLVTHDAAVAGMAHRRLVMRDGRLYPEDKGAGG